MGWEKIKSLKKNLIRQNAAVEPKCQCKLPDACVKKAILYSN